jgi:HAD superfamily hydrolase (TIGR01509 family)
MLVIFDFDGVLVSACDIHYKAFKEALLHIKGVELSLDRHTREFDGLTTRQKIAKLGGINELEADRIWDMKQRFTSEYMKDMKCNENMVRLLFLLKDKGYMLACCSNSIGNTVNTVLHNNGVDNLFNLILSNNDVKYPKPNPQIYLKCMSKLGIGPRDTIIIEDNIVGLESAFYSGAYVIPIPNPNINTNNLMNKITSITSGRFGGSCVGWADPINIVIPAAGLGSRFSGHYEEPKPFIPIKLDKFIKPDKLMIELVIDNMCMDVSNYSNITLIFNKDHEVHYSHLKSLFNIVEIDGLTQGSLCTVLMARNVLMQEDKPLLLANSDQYLEGSMYQFLYTAINSDADGYISVFTPGENDTKWSYAKVGDDGLVTEVREKEPISRVANTGIYWFRSSHQFVRYAERMIEREIKVKNEYYVAPMFNLLIEDGLKVRVHHCDKFWSLGVPEDLETFLKGNPTVPY